MRFGIQTILWGHDPVDYERMFDVIEDAGFEGVELFQDPSNMGSLAYILKLLSNRKRPIGLLGLSGGDLESRVAFLNQPVPDLYQGRGWDPKAVYLYVDEWTNEVEGLLRNGYKLAVHPHYLRKINSANDAFALLDQHPKLLYIPDSAHSTIKREDITKGLTKYSNRLAAVHLKDWRPGFGRASALYARGFTELGNGIVRPEVTLAHLRDHLHYKGWVVLEQDYTEDLVERSVQKAARWLASQKDLTGFKSKPVLIPTPIPQPLYVGGDRINSTSLYEFYSQRFATIHVGQLYQRMAEELKVRFHLSATAIWSCSELEGILTLQGISPLPKGEPPDLTVAYEEFQEHVEMGWRSIRNAHPAILSAFGDRSQRFYRLPVRSTWNPHCTRIVVDLFCDDLFGKADELSQGKVLSKAIARAFDTHLDRLAFSSAADLNLLATVAKDHEDFTDQLKALCKKRLKADAVAIFLADQSGTRLKPLARDEKELTWSPELHKVQHFYEAGDGQETTRIWQSREPWFQGRSGKPRPTEKPTKCKLKSKYPDVRVLSMPIVDTEGRAIGLVRCLNKVTVSQNVCNFSDDDLVVLDHILQQALPTLQLLDAAKEEERRLIVIAHEMKRPLAALSSALSLMMADVGDEKTQNTIPFRVRKQILSGARWSAQLESLVLRSSFLMGRPEKSFAVCRQRVLLKGDIVAATLEQLRHEFSERRFPSGTTWYDDFLDIPALYLDRPMFQQVFFNLLDNAIKYAEEDPKQFKVEIRTEDVGSSYTITISDWGIGIPKELGEALFRLGVRAPDAFRSAAGSGVGLWLIRQLVELHHGTIDLIHHAKPTSFRISLPHKLSNPEWKQ